jgi:predicted esterase
MFAVATLCYAGNGNATFTKGKAKKISDYFTSTLEKKENNNKFNEKISTNKIEEIRSKVWNCWKDAVEDLDEEKLIAPFTKDEPRDTGYWRLPEELEPEAIMPYYFIKKGEKPEKGYPLFLYMHGSGPKTSEWENGFKLCHSYDDAPSLHFIPQIPNGYGELYRWAIQSKQWAWEKLLRLAFLKNDIDPNRIYFYGISEGGYGSQRLASFYADYLAGAGPMAGGEPLKNAPMENLANIAFSLRTGERDYGFGRNYMTYTAKMTMDSLQKVHPGLYNHFIEIVPGMGHSIDYDKTTPWLKQHTRNANPTYFYWEDYDMYGRHRTGFYNLKVNETSRNNDEERTCYEVKMSNNKVELKVKNVSYTTTHAMYNIPMLFKKEYSEATKGNVTIYLSEKHFDFKKPIQIVVNGKEVFNGKVKPNLNAMIESCAEFFDPERIFPASVNVDIR